MDGFATRRPQASVSANFHDQLHGRTGQEFIGAKRSPARIRSNPFILWFHFLYITIAFFCRKT